MTDKCSQSESIKRVDVMLTGQVDITVKRGEMHRERSIDFRPKVLQR